MLAWAWAVETIDRPVYYLDYGSGSGYGAELLATSFQHAFAIEPDENARMYARNLHTRSGVLYFKDLEATGLKNPRFDFITCIEVLEHLEKTDAEKLVERFSKMLTQGGRLVLTTPAALKEGKPENPHHPHEYSPEEFSELINRYFHKTAVQDISMGIPNMMAVCWEPK